MLARLGKTAMGLSESPLTAPKGEAVAVTVQGRQKGYCMGKLSIKKQIEQALQDIFHPGTGKHDTGGKDVIRSRSTFENYLKECKEFAAWVREKYPDRGINTLEKLRPYAEEYLTRSKPNGEAYSAWTICKERAAIAKLYGERCQEVLKDAPERRREDIKRSRGKDYMPTLPIEKQPDYEALGRGAGLRKADFTRIRKEDIEQDGNKVFVHIDKGKGGKERTVYVLPAYAERVLAMADKTAAGERVIPVGTIPNRFDEHACRRYYANEAYRLFARPVDTLEHGSKYFCRGDRVGVILDKDAMRKVSRLLGHGSYNPKTGEWRDRLSVIAISYLAF